MQGCCQKRLSMISRVYDYIREGSYVELAFFLGWEQI